MAVTVGGTVEARGAGAHGVRVGIVNARAGRLKRSGGALVVSLIPPGVCKAAAW